MSRRNTSSPRSTRPSRPAPSSVQLPPLPLLAQVSVAGLLLYGSRYLPSLERMLEPSHVSEPAIALTEAGGAFRRQSPDSTATSAALTPPAPPARRNSGDLSSPPIKVASIAPRATSAARYVAPVPIAASPSAVSAVGEPVRTASSRPADDAFPGSGQLFARPTLSGIPVSDSLPRTAVTPTDLGSASRTRPVTASAVSAPPSLSSSFSSLSSMASELASFRSPRAAEGVKVAQGSSTNAPQVGVLDKGDHTSAPLPSGTKLLTRMALIQPQTSGSGSGSGGAFTWNGGGSDNNWTTGANWGGTAPGAAAGADVTFAGTTRLSPNLDAASSVNSLTFASGAGAFTLGGANALTVGAGGITNNSGNRQAIGVGSLVVGAAQTWNAGTGGLTVAANLSGSSVVTLTGSGVTLAGNNAAFTGGFVLSGLVGGRGGDGSLARAGTTGSAGTAFTLNLASTGAGGSNSVLTLSAGNGGDGGTGGPRPASTPSPIPSPVPYPRPSPPPTGPTLIGQPGGAGGAGGALTVNLSTSNALSANTLTVRAGDGGGEGGVGKGGGGWGGSAGAGGSLLVNITAPSVFSGTQNLNFSAGNGVYASGGDAIVNVSSNNAFVGVTNLTVSGGKANPSYNGGAVTLNISASNALKGLTKLNLTGGFGDYGVGGQATLRLDFTNADGTMSTGNSVDTGADLILTDGGSNGGGRGGVSVVTLNGNNLSVGGLDGDPYVQNGGTVASTLTVGSDNGNHFFHGGLLDYNSSITNGTNPTGTLALVKTGSGILTLGFNTYSGGTAIQQGTLAGWSTALGTGAVSISSGATLAVGEAPKTTTSSQATNKLTIGALKLAGANTTPVLTFNLGTNGVGDTVNGASDVLSLSSLVVGSSGVFDIGFASATGTSLTSSTYTLLTFTTPFPGDVTGLDISTAAAANSEFAAIPVGNLNSLGSGAFAWTFDGGGNVSSLTFTLANASTSASASASTPEPGALTLVLTAGCLPMGAGIMARRKRFSTKG